MDRSQLLEYRSMLVVLQDRVRAAIAEGKSVEELIAENPLADLEARWGGRGPEYTEQTLRIFYSDLSGS